LDWQELPGLPESLELQAWANQEMDFKGRLGWDLPDLPESLDLQAWANQEID